MKIYLAGKIGPNDWRHTIVTGLATVATPVRELSDAETGGHGSVLIFDTMPRAIWGQHDYVGPFFQDPNPWHFDHKFPETPNNTYPAPEAIIDACELAIRSCDIFFAWLDDQTAYGTLVEIGIARALGIEIWIASAPSLRWHDLWFAGTCAWVHEHQCATPAEALKTMLQAAGYWQEPTTSIPPAPRPLPLNRAIETAYNGYRFRSRTEARWAVFFDTLGIAYEYEKEGFTLDGGLRYLPDFWLPQYGCWAEIKPDQGPDDLAARKIAGLAKLTRTDVYVFHGQPWMQKQADGYFIDQDRSAYAALCCAGGEMGDEPFYWCECRRCGHIGLAWCGLEDRLSCGCPNREEISTALSPRLVAAYTAARRARFEYGEHGGR